MRKSIFSAKHVMLLVPAFVFSLLLPAHLLLAAPNQNMKIRRLSPRKSGLYQDFGVFHETGTKSGDESMAIKSVRHFYSDKDKTERIVLDLDAKHLTKIYGYFSQKEKKLYLDLAKTSVNPSLSPIGNSALVKDLVFYPIDNDVLSMEIVLKEASVLDAFYLENPLRLVFDVKSAVTN